MRLFAPRVLVLSVLLLTGSILAVVPIAQAVGPDEAGREKTGRWYVGVEGGMSVMNPFDPRVPPGGKSSFEVGGALALRAGRQWRDHIRFDGVVTWEQAKISRVAGRLDVVAATANVYYDFAEPKAFIRPYVGVGLGVAGGWLESNSPGATGPLALQRGVGMAYLISGGGRFAISDSLTLSCAWQFLGTAALIDAASGGSINPTMHGFMVGLHHSF